MTLTEILDWHRARYPLLGPADVYKLLHQGVYGPGHLITDPASAREYLQQEYRAVPAGSDPSDSSLVPRPSPPPLEPLAPDSRFIRINLRGLEPAAVERLLAALLESAREVPTDHTTMRERLLGAIDWSRQRLPRATAELGEMLERNEQAGFPARHHSAAYQLAYAPAYRVVKPDLFRIDT